jgi:lactoylglutathione lyase
MIRVEDLDTALEWYRTHLGYVEHARTDQEEYTQVFLGPDGVGTDAALLQLTYNHDGRSYTMGDAWGHVALRVRDVADAYSELMAGGVEDYRDPESCGGRYAFVKDPDGHEIELVERDHGARFSLDHTMIRVEDVDRSLGWYVRKLGYVPAGRWESDTFANYFLESPAAPSGAMSLELTYNYDGRSYTLGDAWGHIGVDAEDLQATWETLMERGAENYRDPATCNDLYAFTRDPDGHEIQII